MAKNRFEVIDFLRVIAILAIIWMHTPESFLTKTASLTKFAVPFFTCAAIFFVFNTVKNKPELKFFSYVSSRFKRIYIPFLVWAFIYLFIKIINELFIAKTGFPKFNFYSFLWTSTTPHLWFLPFILISSIISFLIAKLYFKKQKIVKYIIIIIFIFLGYISAAYYQNLNFVNHYTIYLAFLALPSFFWGISLSALYHSKFQKFFEKKAVIIFGLLSFIFFNFYNFYINGWSLLANLAGISCLIGSINPMSNKFISYISKFGVLSMGVYLCHPLFIEGSKYIFKLFGYQFFWGLDLFIFFTSAISSFIFVKILYSYKWSSWLVK